ncbi:MAG TPA: FHA domain-containing protein [Vicinamibacteria bacterium]|nr:FHA domain-containing protein [Vicinamibacteria bacterium]
MNGTLAHGRTGHPPPYRLRGEVGGTLRAYEIAAGQSTIGSMAGNTIVLPVRGVSRRHALITVGQGAATLEAAD